LRAVAKPTGEVIVVVTFVSLNLLSLLSLLSMFSDESFTIIKPFGLLTKLLLPASPAAFVADLAAADKCWAFCLVLECKPIFWLDLVVCYAFIPLNAIKEPPDDEIKRFLPCPLFGFGPLAVWALFKRCQTRS